MKKTVLLCYVVLFLLSAYGALVNLGHVSFWDDEAFVGMVAKRYVETGEISGWTGRNLYGYANGKVLDADLRPINPILDVLVASWSFRIFGVSTWAARFPFVIAGLLTLILFGVVVRREWPGQTATQLYAFGSLALGTGFLLNIRTARYYALVMLFTVICYYAYQNTLTNKRKRDFLILALGATGLFYTHYLNCVVFLGALFIMHLALHRKEWTPLQWRQCLLAILLFLALTMPYAIIFRVWDGPFFPSSKVQGYLRYVYLLKMNFMGWIQGGLLSLIVLMGIIALLTARPLRVRFQSIRISLLSWFLLLVTYTFLLAMLSPAPANSLRQITELRYFAPILPFCAGLTGLCLGALHSFSRYLAAAMFIFLISCNSLFGASFTWTLPGFIHEIHSPYPTSASETVKFLQLHAKQDDVVRIVDQHHNYPVMFYLDDKVRFGALLDKNTPVSPENVQRVGNFLRLEQTFPNWLIFYSKTQDMQIWLDYLSRPFQQKGKWVTYDYRLEKELDVFFNQSQRPELHWHSFGPLLDYDKSIYNVYIYRRSGPRPTTPPKPGQAWIMPSVRD